ncbi:hypothetical protein CDD83_9067 [Cordyceps sp. RAO-2017]|nr:hypothetical protein CDD83_9067 [Cordyceps sp. RAO-2017]
MQEINSRRTAERYAAQRKRLTGRPSAPVVDRRASPLHWGKKKGGREGLTRTGHPPVAREEPDGRGELSTEAGPVCTRRRLGHRFANVMPAYVPCLHCAASAGWGKRDSPAANPDRRLERRRSRPHQSRLGRQRHEPVSSLQTDGDDRRRAGKMATSSGSAAHSHGVPGREDGLPLALAHRMFRHGCCVGAQHLDLRPAAAAVVVAFTPSYLAATRAQTIANGGGGGPQVTSHRFEGDQVRQQSMGSRRSTGRGPTSTISLPAPACPFKAPDLLGRRLQPTGRPCQRCRALLRHLLLPGHRVVPIVLRLCLGLGHQSRPGLGMPIPRNKRGGGGAGE